MTEEKISYRISWEVSGVHTEDFDGFEIDAKYVKTKRMRNGELGNSELIRLDKLITIDEITYTSKRILIGAQAGACHLEDPFGTGEE